MFVVVVTIVVVVFVIVFVFVFPLHSLLLLLPLHFYPFLLSSTIASAILEVSADRVEIFSVMNHPTEKHVVDIRWGVREDGKRRKRRTTDNNEVSS